MPVTLALGDSRLVYAVICPTIDDLNSSGASIDESPRIPESLQERTVSNVPLPSPPVPMSHGQGEEVRASFSTTFVISHYLLTIAHREKTWSKFQFRGLRALTSDYVFPREDRRI